MPPAPTPPPAAPDELDLATVGAIAAATTAAAVATAGGAMAVAAYMKSSATAASWRASFAAPGGVTLASAVDALGQVKLAPSNGVDPATWTLRSVLGYQTVAQ